MASFGRTTEGRRILVGGSRQHRVARYDNQPTQKVLRSNERKMPAYHYGDVVSSPEDEAADVLIDLNRRRQHSNSRIQQFLEEGGDTSSEDNDSCGDNPPQLLLGQRTQESTQQTQLSGSETIVLGQMGTDPLTIEDDEEDDEALIDVSKVAAYEASMYSAKNFLAANSYKLPILFCMTLSIPHPNDGNKPLLSVAAEDKKFNFVQDPWKTTVEQASTKRNWYRVTKKMLKDEYKRRHELAVVLGEKRDKHGVAAATHTTLFARLTEDAGAIRYKEEIKFIQEEYLKKEKLAFDQLDVQQVVEHRHRWNDTSTMRLIHCICDHDDVREAFLTCYAGQSRQALDGRNATNRPLTFEEHAALKYNDQSYVPMSTVMINVHSDFTVAQRLPFPTGSRNVTVDNIKSKLTELKTGVLWVKKSWELSGTGEGTMEEDPATGSIRFLADNLEEFIQNGGKSPVLLYWWMMMEKNELTESALTVLSADQQATGDSVSSDITTSTSRKRKEPEPSAATKFLVEEQKTMFSELKGSLSNIADRFIAAETANTAAPNADVVRQAMESQMNLAQQRANLRRMYNAAVEQNDEQEQRILQEQLELIEEMIRANSKKYVS